MAPVHCAAGSDGETNFGFTSLAAPKARCQILTNGSSGIGVEATDPPLIAGNRPLLVGVGHDQARIHREAFATDKTLAQAPQHHRLEQMPQDIALPEPAMTVAREGGVVRHPAVKSQATKPAIGQIEMDFIAQPPFGSDAHAVPDNQHPSPLGHCARLNVCCSMASLRRRQMICVPFCSVRARRRLRSSLRTAMSRRAILLMP